MKHWLRLLAFTCLFALAAAPATAGLIIHYQGGGMAGPDTVYLQDDKVRQDMGSMVVIMDVASGKVYYLNPAKKTYWGGTVADLQNSAKDAEKQMMDQMLEKLPPEQREQVRRAMTEQMQAAKPKVPKVTFSVKKTGKTEKIAGYNTEEYQVMADGKPMMSLWLAPDLPVDEEVNPDKLAELMSGLAQGSGGPNPMASPEVHKLFTKGYPLKTEMQIMGQDQGGAADKVEKKPIKSDMFEVPQGYKKVGMLDVMM